MDFFFDKQTLMGSFAEENIRNIAIAQKFLVLGLGKIKFESLDEAEKKIYKFLEENNLKKMEDIKKMIGDDFLKENLFYL